MNALLQLDRVTKLYEAETVVTRAVHDATLTIAAGEIVAITGPSGSGKSTLLSLAGLLERPSSGEIFVAGHPASRLSAGARAAVRNATFGYVFQSFHLIPHLSVIANVMMPLMYRGVGSAVSSERAARMLQLVGLAHRTQHLASQLSGGEQQRVAIARALVGDPQAILADEPTGNLDSANAEAVIALLEEAASRGVTVVLVTHDEALASRAMRRVRMCDGQLVSDGALVAAEGAA